MIPFSVIGGFLGAGKTTLINQLLRRESMPRLAILVNDFGDIAVDSELLEAHGGDTITLKNGCICCSIGNDLGRALGRVLDSDTPVDHILVEASGVANPARVMDVARLSAELQPAGTMVVVDAGAILEQLDDRWIADSVAAQLDSADWFFLNKLEVVDDETRSAVQGCLARDYSDTAQTCDCDAVWPLIAGFGAGPDRLFSGQGTHPTYCSRSLVSERELDPGRLQAWISAREDVYRIKGWVRLGQGETRLLQYAGNRLSWTPAEPTGGEAIRLVVIGRDGLPADAEILDDITVETSPGLVAC